MENQKQPSTDRDVLSKGVKRLMMAIPFFIAGPILIYIGAGSEHPIIFLLPGISCHRIYVSGNSNYSRLDVQND